jgi:hypothetical protein
MRHLKKMALEKLGTPGTEHGLGEVSLFNRREMLNRTSHFGLLNPRVITSILTKPFSSFFN